MTAFSRLAAALLGPARFLVWGWMVALVLLAAGTPGRDVMSSAVAIDPTEFMAYGTSEDPASSTDLSASEMRSQHEMTVAGIAAGNAEGGRFLAGCRRLRHAGVPRRPVRTRALGGRPFPGRPRLGSDRPRPCAARSGRLDAGPGPAPSVRLSPSRARTARAPSRPPRLSP